MVLPVKMPAHYQPLVECVRGLYADQRLIDVTLACQGRQIMGHKIVLVAYSKMLDMLLMGNADAMATISLNGLDIDARCVEMLVTYMYTGVLSDVSEVGSVPLIKTAQVMGMTSILQDLSEDVLLQQQRKPTGDHGDADEASEKSLLVPDHSKPGASEIDAEELTNGSLKLEEGDVEKEDASREAGELQGNKKEDADAMVVTVPQPKMENDSKGCDGETDSDEDTPEDADSWAETKNAAVKVESDTAKKHDATNLAQPRVKIILRKRKESKLDPVVKRKRGRPRKHPIDSQKTKLKTPGRKGKVTKTLGKTLPALKKGKPRVRHNARQTQEKQDGDVSLRTEEGYLSSKFILSKACRLSDGSYMCPLCDWKAKTNRNFLAHYRRHTGERPHGCHYCDKRFLMKKHLVEHERIHTGERPYKCEYCDMTFKCTKHRNRHRKIHTGEKNYQCEECGKVYRDKGTMLKHVQVVHRQERPYKCNYGQCEACFCDKVSLAHHHMRKHKPECLEGELTQLTTMCDVCGKSLLARSVRAHMKMHGGAEFKCEQCCFKTRYKNALDGHLMRQHNVTISGKKAERPHMCEQCATGFFTANELRMHMMRHSGEKPHKCPICNFATIDKGTLTKHMRQHTGEQPFRCKQCSKAFTSQSGLARHKRMHLNIKPHKCEVCGKVYADKKSKDIHLFTHGGIKPYVCHICDYGCTKKEFLTKHIRERHNIAALQDIKPRLSVPEYPVPDESDKASDSSVTDRGKTSVILVVNPSRESPAAASAPREHKVSTQVSCKAEEVDHLEQQSSTTAPTPKYAYGLENPIHGEQIIWATVESTDIRTEVHP